MASANALAVVRARVGVNPPASNLSTSFSAAKSEVRSSKGRNSNSASLGLAPHHLSV
jgi:hypothetical protein